MPDIVPAPAATPAIKPGYKTSEFYLTAISYLVSLAFMSGFVGTGTLVEKVFATAAMVLGLLGYQVSRGMAKK